jgi:hypothetical protein
VAADAHTLSKRQALCVPAVPDPTQTVPTVVVTAPLTSEPPLADAAPLTSEPPLAEAAPLTSEPTAPGTAVGTEPSGA